MRKVLKDVWNVENSEFIQPWILYKCINVAYNTTVEEKDSITFNHIRSAIVIK